MENRSRAFFTVVCRTHEIADLMAKTKRSASSTVLLIVGQAGFASARAFFLLSRSWVGVCVCGARVKGTSRFSIRVTQVSRLCNLSLRSLTTDSFFVGGVI